MRATKDGRPLYRWIARFTRRDNFDRIVAVPPRDIWAVNEFQARIKAGGIAEKDGWKLESLGRA